jgi:hypothetical protein
VKIRSAAGRVKEFSPNLKNQYFLTFQVGLEPFDEGK